MDHVMKYLWSKGLVSKEQHAFIMKYSTVTNLLECTHDWGAGALKMQDQKMQDLQMEDHL